MIQKSKTLSEAFQFLINKNEENEKKMKKLEKNICDNQNENNELKQTFKEMEKKYDELYSEFIEKSKKIEEVQIQFQKENILRKNLEQEYLSEKQKIIKDHISQKERFKSGFEELTGINENLTKKLKEKENFIETLNLEIDKLKKDKQEIQTNCNKAIKNYEILFYKIDLENQELKRNNKDHQKLTLSKEIENLRYSFSNNNNNNENISNSFKNEKFFFSNELLQKSLEKEIEKDSSKLIFMKKNNN